MAKKKALRKRIKNDLIFFVAKFVMRGAAAIPLKVGLKIGPWLGRGAYFVLRGDRAKSLAHLKVAFPDSNVAWRRRISRESFANLGRSFFELFHFEEILSAEEGSAHAVRIVGREHLFAMLTKGRGGIVMTGHIGNWELLGAFGSRIGLPLNVVVRSLYDPRIDAMLNDHRRKFDYPPVARGEGEILEIVKILRKNRLLVLLMDQDTKVRGAFLPFLGPPAHTPTGPAYLAYATDCEVVACFIHRDPKGGHVVEVSPIERPRTGDNRADIHEYTRIFNDHISEHIRRHPTEWVWLHRRWKKRPPGEAAHLNPVPKLPPRALARRALIFAASGLARSLSREGADVLGSWLGIASHWFSRRRREAAKRNIRIALGGSASESLIRDIEKRATRNRGKMGIDYLRAGSLDREYFESSMAMEGVDELRSALEGKRGAILVSAHFGSLDLGLWRLCREGIPLNLLDRKIKDPVFRAWVAKLRLVHGLKTLAPESDEDILLELLARNECVVIPIDRNPPRDKGVFVRFFHRQVNTDITCARVASKSNAPLLPAYTLRVGPGMHRLVIKPALELAGIGEGNFLRELTQRCTGEWEKIIRKHPDQWTWGHDRFVLRP